MQRGFEKEILFFVAVIVAAARGNQTVFPRNLQKRGDVGFGVPGIIRLQSRQSVRLQSLDERVQSLVVKIFLGVSEDGHAAEFPDESDGGERGDALCLDIRRALCAEIAVEGFLHGCHGPAAHHCVGDVLPAHSPCAEIDVGRHAERGEPLAYHKVAGDAHNLDFLELLHKVGVFVVDIIS